MAFFIGSEDYHRLIKPLDTTSQDDVVVILERLAAFNRTNTLSTIYHAGRGWIGASLSIIDLLTVLYFYLIDSDMGPDEGDQVLLSKGHAAAAQYAVLAGKGWLPVEELKRYKEPDGPQAHTDLRTPGIAVNTGSLGQTLSKAFGMAWKSRRMFYVVLGDGELQEGQNFEALMSIAHYRSTNIVPIVDRNQIQSDSEVADIKRLDNLERVLEGLGFRVLNVDGNSISQLLHVLAAAKSADTPCVVVADTLKGAGISFMQRRQVGRGQYSWHGGVPDSSEYREALREISSSFLKDPVKIRLDVYLDGEPEPGRPRPAAPAAPQSTGDAYAEQLVEMAGGHPEIVVLDADLEKSCRLGEFAKRFPDQFLEMGIAEQDMISTAGGLGLSGRLPFVNTYAAFYRRGYEQVYINATERTKIVYAAHYSGLCYATDGKSHQCTGDVGMMRCIPGMRVVYPTFNSELEGIFDWYLNEVESAPLYLRLHRTPFLLEFDLPEDVSFHPERGVAARQRGGRVCVLTAGPQMTVFCSLASDEIERSRQMDVDVHRVSTLCRLSDDYLTELSNSYEALIIVEETIGAGGLFDLVAAGFAALSAKSDVVSPILFHHAPDDFTFSTLEPLGLYEHFKLTPLRLSEMIFSLCSAC